MQQASYKGPWGTMTPLEWGPPKYHTYDTKNGCELQSRYVSQTFKCLHIYKSLHIGHNMFLFLHWSPALNHWLFAAVFASSCIHTYSTVCKQQCATWWQHMVLPAWGSVFHSTQGEEGLYTYQTNPIDSSSSAWHSKHRESWTAENVF